MARTVIREQQFLDSDFLSEEEFNSYRGSENGFAPLDSNLKIPTNYLYGEGITLPLGWKDNIVPLNAGNTGNPENAPLFADSGNGIWGYCFADYYPNFAYCDFHINHDYKLGSKIYPHIHWMPMSYSTGNVKWKFEYIKAKGHQQGESLTGTLTSFNIIGTGKGLKGEHMVTECSDDQAFIVDEPDTIVRVKISRLGGDPEDTFYGAVMCLMVDFHYQSETETTPNKAPNFYGE